LGKHYTEPIKSSTGIESSWTVISPTSIFYHWKRRLHKNVDSCKQRA